jgi:hypothetical protein
MFNDEYLSNKVKIVLMMCDHKTLSRTVLMLSRQDIFVSGGGCRICQKVSKTAVFAGGKGLRLRL